MGVGIRHSFNLKQPEWMSAPDSRRRGCSNPGHGAGADAANSRMQSCREAAQAAGCVIARREMKKAMRSVVLDDEDAHEDRADRNRQASIWLNRSNELSRSSTNTTAWLLNAIAPAASEST
jgi:hypothetical protein